MESLGFLICRMGLLTPSQGYLSIPKLTNRILYYRTKLVTEGAETSRKLGGGETERRKAAIHWAKITAFPKLVPGGEAGTTGRRGGRLHLIPSRDPSAPASTAGSPTLVPRLSCFPSAPRPRPRLPPAGGRGLPDSKSRCPVSPRNSPTLQLPLAC